MPSRYIFPRPPLQTLDIPLLFRYDTTVEHTDDRMWREGNTGLTLWHIARRDDDTRPLRALINRFGNDLDSLYVLDFDANTPLHLVVRYWGV